MPISTVGHLSAILKRIATLGRGKRYARHGDIVVNIAHLRLLTHISYQHHLVHIASISLTLTHLLAGKTEKTKREILSLSRRELTAVVNTLLKMI